MAQPLRIAMGTYPWTASFAEALESFGIVDAEIVTMSPIMPAFRSMCRGESYDVCELALSTYFVAKAYGLPFHAIPVFPVRGVYSSVMSSLGVETVADLEGKRIGLRAYTVTAGVWTRMFLSLACQLDLDSVTWVLADEEHVQAFHRDAPKNLEYQVGANLDLLLEQGEIDAVMGSKAPPTSTIRPLMADQVAREESWARGLGIFPINHTIVIGDRARSANSELASIVYESYRSAKEKWLSALENGRIPTAEESRILNWIPWVGDDPLPYGLESNLATIETLHGNLAAQRIPTLPDPVAQFDGSCGTK